ncbi:hypothetical protein MMC34_008421 [Xylographa carneopallida]|nr:hypothetical protein [Xylographa carneopallida]
MTSALATRLDLDGWKARCGELSSPHIAQSRYDELIAAFAAQIHRDLDDPHSLSAAALAAPRVNSSTDRRGLNQPAQQIASALFALNRPDVDQPAAPQSDDEEYDVAGDVEYERVRLWARIRYTQALSSLSSRLRTALKDEDCERLQRLNTTHVHASREAYDALKERPVSRDVIHPFAMPVTQTELCELQPFFHFLHSDTNPFDCGVDERQAMCERFGAKYSGADNNQFEFQRGVFYTDARMDLCKQTVGPAHIEALMQSLRPNRHVRHFLLGNNVIGRNGADSIASFLRDRRAQPELPAIRTWYVAGCAFDGESMGRLVDEWQHEPSVEAIWLKRNPLSLSGAQQVARLLSSATCARLRILDVDNSGLLDEGAVVVFDALRHNHSLRHLYISANGIGPVGAHSAARYLEYVRDNCPRVKGLRSLFMSVNRMGDEGAIVLAGALSGQRHLKRLLLASNRIESAGAVALAAALEHNDVLQVLDLGLYTSTGDLGELPNRIEDSGAAALARALSTNSSLRYLSIAHNGLTPAAYQPVADAVLASSTLCYLEMVERGQPRPPQLWADMQSAVKANAQRLYGLSESGISHFVMHNLRNIRSCKDIESVYRTRDFIKSKRAKLVKRWPNDDYSAFF